MQTFKWNKSYEVFIPEIDAEHKAICRLASTLERAVSAGAPQPELKRSFDELNAQVAAHFDGEEQMMRASRYPAYQWHKRQHQTAAAKAAELAGQIEEGDRDAALESLQFLSGWLRDHTGVTDRLMGAFLRNYLRTNTAVAS